MMAGILGPAKAAAWWLLQAPTTSAFALADSVALCFLDVVTQAPVVGVTVREERAAPRVLTGSCGQVSTGGVVRVARIGYEPRRLVVPPSATVARDAGRASVTADTLRLYLHPSRGRLAAGVASDSVAVLATQRITARAPTSPPGATSAAITTTSARERGVVSMNGVVTLLPYTSIRSARGESGLSLRGARREQVVITLDGLPLNDPATGLADVSDLPLVAVQSATVRPGADPVGTGSGAAGGVLALSSAPQRAVSVRTGAFGHVAAEAAWAASAMGVRWNATAALQQAANDFAFTNEAGAAPVREQRVNNDERRAVISGGLIAAQTQWNLLVSTGERGMVGPANVRAFDNDRSVTTRTLLRGQTTWGTTVLTSGVRHFALRYRDPARPALDAQARAWAGEVEWRGSAWRGMWRVGTGADGLTGTGAVSQRRARGFAAWAWQRATSGTEGRAPRLDLDLGVRADAVERNGVQPTASAGLAWRARGAPGGSSLVLLARGAQAVRVPTLYDLYFSSPQRLFVRALRAERVTLDASGGAQGVWHRGERRLTGELLLVARDTRDAIVWFPGNFGWSPANVGREQLRGTESRVELTTPVITLSAWHTRYASTLRSGLLTIPTPYVPLHSGAVQALWRVGAHTLSANVRHQGRRPFTAGPRDPRFELPSVTLTDVAWARRQRVAQVEALVSLTIDNVTGVRWQSVRGFPMPGRGWSAALTLQPRT
ncbi:TonB-dependent receptor plug domain-containing protein [Gemmatimonas sp.]|uniref:TonB-dependent receptor plug domain-containing protein n=1 Tax=Gemmatimonas sp. TaxID=1962908 RepID=UPI0022BE19A5|nr:TonB-dependent receptor plug domain-containing protein [Gemmatimonas sp.]MCZ8204521.1 TonB-dependent receptor plug domain-containing protein [Gemmatimonas sp.]